MSLEAVLSKAIPTIPECVACGYIDLSTGMLLAVKSVDSQPSEVMDLLAAATADLFQGTNVVAIEDIFKKARGISGDVHYFKEIVIFSENLLHVFMRGKKYEDHVVCFVCKKSANVGMVLTKSRLVLPTLEAAV